MLPSDKDSMTEDQAYVIKDSIANEGKYIPWHGSAFWNGKLELKQFVDALMHLIFLGVMKSTKKLISKWIQMSRRTKSFNELTRGLLTPIIEMGLDWCKVIEVESGWVSDNYLAFARLMKWYYHPLMVLQPDADYKKLCRLNDINNCVGNLLSMISIVMIREVKIKDTSDELNREIRIFLTYIHTISTSMDECDSTNNVKKKDTGSTVHIIEKERNKKRTPYWIKKYNYMSLLNLPDAMNLYGPLINLWEGANKGEGYLRFAKPMIKDIHSVNWQVNAHSKLLRGNAFDSVVNCHVINKCTKPINGRYIDYINMRENRKKKMYFPYSTVTSLYSIFRRNRPISCIMTKHNCYYAIVKTTSSVMMKGQQIIINYDSTFKSLNMNFHKVNMNEASYLDLHELKEESISKYILLLPKLGELGYANNQNTNLYYIIDSEWNELNKNMVFCRPTSPGCKY